MTPVYFHHPIATFSIPELDHIPRVGELVDYFAVGRSTVTEVRHDLSSKRIHVTLNPEKP